MQQKAYKGEITLAFDYKSNASAQVVRENIESERISYLMIENRYENVNILPVIYLSLHISYEMYDKVINSAETSKFYLKIRKKDALSGTSIYKKILEDTFTYVTSTTNNNYADGLNNGNDDTYKTIMIGLVSESMTNKLRQSFNGIYNDITQEDLVNIALNGLGKTILQPLDYNNHFDAYLIPPLSSRYKLLSYLFDHDAFYNSNFTFFMDFNATYLVAKDSKAVGDAPSVIVDIRDYTANDAYVDGFTIQNGAYVVKVNAANTNMIINNATSKLATHIIGYGDDTGAQNLDLNSVYNTENNQTKNIYVRSDNAAAIKNEMDSGSVILELLKQNIDTDLFTPDKVFDVSNYNEYNIYNGKYFLSYKRDFYYPDSSGEFILTTNVALKKAPTIEEVRETTENSINISTNKSTSNSSNRSSSKSKKQMLKSVTRSSK